LVKLSGSVRISPPFPSPPTASPLLPQRITPSKQTQLFLVFDTPPLFFAETVLSEQHLGCHLSLSLLGKLPFVIKKEGFLFQKRFTLCLCTFSRPSQGTRSTQGFELEWKFFSQVSRSSFPPKSRPSKFFPDVFFLPPFARISFCNSICPIGDPFFCARLFPPFFFFNNLVFSYAGKFLGQAILNRILYRLIFLFRAFL